MDPTEISALVIDLYIANQPSLFILLAADGRRQNDWTSCFSRASSGSVPSTVSSATSV
ncbi:MAG TPA: hypothetical protein VGY54_20510 [Polyangiaceae bacterium]|nr:hypothetical protein [Polyangiaceae bacterium]